MVAQVNGSLIERMSALVDQNVTVGVLVIDEQGDHFGGANADDLIKVQQKLLIAAGRLGCRFWLIEYNVKAGAAPTKRTTARIRAVLHSATPIVAKKRFNAFEGTNLHASMIARGVDTHVVVLGHEANCCVRFTAIGGQFKPNTPFVQGATGRGYTVLTTPGVLSSIGGVPANWMNQPSVEFYSQL